MSTHKKIDLICVVCVIIGLVITGLFMFGESLGIEVMHDEDSDINDESQYFSKKDLIPDWDTSAATVITLSGDEAKISGTGAYFYDGNLYITGGGYYTLTGSLTDGSIIVDAHKNSKVWILLDGVNIYASDTAAMFIKKADKVFATLAADSENSLSSGTVYSDEAQDAGINAVIYAKDDLTINGYGTLTLTGGCLHGIKAKDDFIITGGTLNITCPGDGINANDSIRITAATLSIVSGSDGLDQDNQEGYLYIESGEITIESGKDAIHTVGQITIDGGNLSLAASDDAIHSNTEITVNAGEIEIIRCSETIEAPGVYVSDDANVREN